VVPPEEELPSLAEGRFRALHARWVEEALHEVVGLPALQRALADEFMEAFKLENSERYINAHFNKDDAFSWRGALDDVLEAIQDAKHTDALKEAVHDALVRKFGQSE
jgi:thioesterase domain-containing protein